MHDFENREDAFFLRTLHLTALSVHCTHTKAQFVQKIIITELLLRKRSVDFVLLRTIVYVWGYFCSHRSKNSAFKDY